MIESLKIENFRCFSSLSVGGLKRVNLIVGPNSSGKTSFLESLFLVAGSAAAAAAFQLRGLRQLGNVVQLVSDSAAYQGLWEDLFHWFEQGRTITIDARGSAGDSRSLKVSYNESTSQLLPFGSEVSQSVVFPQIVFEWQRGDETAVIIKPKITPQGLIFEGASTEYFPVILFGPHTANAPEENAKRFSALSKEGKSDSITRALKDEYPFLESLSIEYNSSIPAVFASVKGNSRKMQLACCLTESINFSAFSWASPLSHTELYSLIR